MLYLADRVKHLLTKRKRKFYRSCLHVLRIVVLHILKDCCMEQKPPNETTD